MLNPEEIFNMLQDNGLDFFSGVPDSLLKDFCAYVADHSENNKIIITSNEGNAIALASGYHLATGKIGVVYLQNSGLGNCINPLTSLTDSEVYSIPLLMIIGWRGQPGVKDEPQHLKMGKITQAILEAADIPYAILPEDNDEAKRVIETASNYMLSKSRPYAILVSKGTFETYELQNKKETNFPITREAALKTIVPLLGKKDIVVSTTGKTSRELFELREKLGQNHEKDFLCVGSMGHASSIALGVALQSEKEVYCLDGDGALIMHMGSLSSIGQLKPKNFKHIIFNNFAHDSVGGQPTAADTIDMQKIALGNGYNEAFCAKSIEEIKYRMNKIKSIEGPVLLEIRCNKGARADLGRPTRTPLENKEEFVKFVQQEDISRYSEDIKDLPKFIELTKPKNIFLVTGKKSYEQSGAKDKVESMLDNIETINFSEFSVNPKLEDVEKGIRIFNEEKCDLVIAVGGGSVIDIAKAINVLASQEGKAKDYVEGHQKILHPGKPLVAIPTTSGSGAEATHFSVVYIANKKYSLAHEFVLPEYVINDSALTSSMPSKLAAVTGMDALCQAIESYWSVNSTKESQKYSEEAIKLITTNLINSVKSGSVESRRAMSRASYLAGKAINIAKTTAPHALSYMLTSKFGIPHGHAVALTLGNTLVYNSRVSKIDCNDERGETYVRKTMEKLVNLMGCSSALEARGHLDKLMRDIGLETSLDKMGVSEEDMGEIVKSVNQERLKNNPRKMSQEVLRRLVTIEISC
jgi:phosphonopyruvate decarboxylase